MISLAVFGFLQVCF